MRERQSSWRTGGDRFAAELVLIWLVAVEPREEPRRQIRGAQRRGAERGDVACGRGHAGRGKRIMKRSVGLVLASPPLPAGERRRLYCEPALADDGYRGSLRLLQHDIFKRLRRLLRDVCPVMIMLERSCSITRGLQGFGSQRREAGD